MADFEVSGTGGEGLRELETKLAVLAGGSYRQVIHTDVASAVGNLVKQEFATGTGPDGKPWKPTQRGNQPLIGKTRDLSNSVNATPTSDGVRIEVTDWKAGFHQTGTRRGIPARPMLPDGKMPAPWRPVIREVVRAFFAQFFG